MQALQLAQRVRFIHMHGGQLSEGARSREAQELGQIFEASKHARQERPWKRQARA
jgi:hypothetical protein